MALKAQDVKRTLELDLADAEKYLAGETLNCDMAKGWALVVYKGVSLGWCKCDGCAFNAIANECDGSNLSFLYSPKRNPDRSILSPSNEGAISGTQYNV